MVGPSGAESNSVITIVKRLAESKRIDFRWLTKAEVDSLRRDLDYLHNSEMMSLLEISRRTRRSFTFIWWLCKRLGVEVRSVGEANKLSSPKRSTRLKTPFSGTMLDEAYIKGFAEGDLDVRKVSSLAIMASSTTTHPAFAGLFWSLFSVYGPVYQYPIYEDSRGYRWKVVARLDNSFLFMLPEQRKNYPVFREGPCKFFAWLAGLVDSDGSIGMIRAGEYARVNLFVANQNNKLLSHIKKELSRAGYHPSGPYVSAPKGQVTPSWSIRYNRDMLSLYLHRTDEVKSLLSKLPLRHEEKIRRKELVLSFKGTPPLDELRTAGERFQE